MMPHLSLKSGRNNAAILVICAWRVSSEPKMPRCMVAAAVCGNKAVQKIGYHWVAPNQKKGTQASLDPFS